MNTFDGANLDFPNLGIHFLLAEVIKFRKQLTVRDEFKSQSGWDNALNNYMVKGLEQLADTLENITYNPTDATQEELEADASDTNRALADDYDERALSHDNVLMPTSKNRRVVWDLAGGDEDIPQMTPATCPNDHARAFVTHLDDVFVQLSRLDTRFQANMITKYESVMIRAYLNNLYTITQRKGGEDARVDTPQGTLPSQESTTFTG